MKHKLDILPCPTTQELNNPKNHAGETNTARAPQRGSDHDVHATNPPPHEGS